MILERGVYGRVCDPECRESISLKQENGYFYHFSLRTERKVEYRGRQVNRLGDKVM